MKEFLLTACFLLSASSLAHATDWHMQFVTIGPELQHNLVCHSGPIHLAEMPMDPDIYQFWKAHPAQAHE
jgi:hypothetical protein